MRFSPSAENQNNSSFLPWHNSPQWAKASSLSKIHDHTHTHTHHTRWDFLDEWSARRRSLYLTTHN